MNLQIERKVYNKYVQEYLYGVTFDIVEPIIRSRFPRIERAQTYFFQDRVGNNNKIRFCLTVYRGKFYFTFYQEAKNRNTKRNLNYWKTRKYLNLETTLNELKSFL